MRGEPSRLLVNLYNYEWKWLATIIIEQCSVLAHYVMATTIKKYDTTSLTSGWIIAHFVSYFLSNCTVIKWELKRVILVLYLICSVGIAQSRSDNRLCNRRFSCSIECWIWLAKNPCAIVMRLNPGIPLIVLLLQYYCYTQCTVSKDWINFVACMGTGKVRPYIKSKLSKHWEIPNFVVPLWLLGKLKAEIFIHEVGMAINDNIRLFIRKN